MPSKYSRVCSNHFHDEEVSFTKLNRRNLKKNALPFISDEAVSMERPQTPQNENNVDISDINSIFDSPRRAYLKRKKIPKSSIN